MKKISLAFVLATVLVAGFVSCKKDKSNEPDVLSDGPKDTITDFYVNFYNVIDSTTEVGAYADPDGPGPLESTIGGVSLKANSLYLVTMTIEDATSSSTVYIHNKIKNNGKDYKICVDNPLGISVSPTDSDGSMPIGLVNDLTTSSTTGNDKINFSIKYQKGVKDGQCSPGVLYYNCSIPVTVY